MVSRERGVVVVAEDDDVQRELLKELLEGEGYRVLPARNAEELEAHLDVDVPDLVLLDLVGVATPQVVQRMQRNPDRPALCIVSAARVTADVAQKIGAEGFIYKPYELARLLQQVAALVGDRRRRALHLAVAGG